MVIDGGGYMGCGIWDWGGGFWFELRFEGGADRVGMGIDGWFEKTR
jgi:hypothetical protein